MLGFLLDVSYITKRLNKVVVWLLIANGLPQLHFIGTEDKVIPKEVASSFVAQLESSAKWAGIVEVKAVHQANWLMQW